MKRKNNDCVLNEPLLTTIISMLLLWRKISQNTFHHQHRVSSSILIYTLLQYYEALKFIQSWWIDFSQRTSNSFKNKMFINSPSMRKRRKRSRLIMSILQSAGNNLITLNAVWNECSLTYSLAWWCGECLTWPYKTYL